MDQLRCPVCGALAGLDVLIAHDASREAIQMALQMPAPLGKLLIGYLTLFRPAKRALTPERTATLLGELLPMVIGAQVRFDGQDWPAPMEVWPAAIQEMLDRDKVKPFSRPLKNHNYLLTIIVGKCNAANRKKLADEEEKVEQQRRFAPKGKRAGGLVNPAEAVSGLRGALRGGNTV